ncbi:hypothetical protein Droror1_Dr00023456 [Drosera rotundifolia]
MSSFPDKDDFGHLSTRGNNSKIGKYGGQKIKSEKLLYLKSGTRNLLHFLSSLIEFCLQIVQRLQPIFPSILYLIRLRNFGDVFIPDYCRAGVGELRPLNAWFGPAGVVTRLCHDPHHDTIAQVVGKKYLRLYPAFLSEELYPHNETILCNSSK